MVRLRRLIRDRYPKWSFFAQFIIPMLALLSHRLKQSPRGLAAIGLWVLAAHAVDT